MMHKRYLRIDLEYDMDINPLQLHSFALTDNIKRILQEDMPYVKIIFTRDSPGRDDLDRPAGSHKSTLVEPRTAAGSLD